jgi:hypothetical protein
VLRRHAPRAPPLHPGRPARWPINAWSREGTPPRLVVTVGTVRDPRERITHWVATFAPAA